MRKKKSLIINNNQAILRQRPFVENLRAIYRNEYIRITAIWESNKEN